MNFKTDHLNCLSLDVIEKVGNKSPNQKQIDFMTSILKKVLTIQDIFFDKRLTKREISCLYWAAMGKTALETAELLSINFETVKQHRQKIKKKLNCKTITEAVFLGVQIGYVQANN